MAAVGEHMDEFFVTFHLRITVPQVGKFVEVLVRSTIMGAQPVTAEVVNEGIGGDWMQTILVMVSDLHDEGELGAFLTINCIE